MITRERACDECEYVQENICVTSYKHNAQATGDTHVRKCEHIFLPVVVIRATTTTMDDGHGMKTHVLRVKTCHNVCLIRVTRSPRQKNTEQKHRQREQRAIGDGVRPGATAVRL